MSYIQNGIGTGAFTINTQTASYQAALIDSENLIEMNVASANTLTVPNNSVVAFPIGTFIRVVQVGIGTTTVAAAAGVTGDNFGSFSARWSAGTLYKRGTNEWVLTVGL